MRVQVFEQAAKGGRFKLRAGRIIKVAQIVLLPASTRKRGGRALHAERQAMSARVHTDNTMASSSLTDTSAWPMSLSK